MPLAAVSLAIQKVSVQNAARKGTVTELRGLLAAPKTFKSSLVFGATKIDLARSKINPNKLPPNTMSSDFATRYKKIEKPVGEGTYGVRSLLALPRCLSFSLSPPAATLSLPQKKEY